MKSKWETRKLGSVCSFLNRGVSPKYVESGGIAVLNQRCVRDHCLTFEVARRHDTNAKKVGIERLIRAGDVLVNSTGTGTLGRVAQLRSEPLEPTTVDSHITIVRPSPGLFFPEFFGYMMRDIEDAIKESGEGASGQTELSRRTLSEKFAVRFPDSKTEQQRIVGVLDEAFEGIPIAKMNAEKNRENARALFESYHDFVFASKRNDWTQRPLGEVCEYVNGKAHEQCIDENGRFIVVNSRFISSEGGILKRSNQALLLLQPGDITMVLSDVPNGKALAKCFLVDKANTYTLNQRICLIRSTKLHKKFLFHQINRNPHFLSFDNGENQTNLRLNQVLSCPLFLPPFDEQERLAANLDTMLDESERLEAIYESKVEALDTLKRSLLHEAFSGQL
jgi:type I restriction enzyme, S subunit